ncbi:MAG: hypothetical protein Q8L36_00500 [bacterium]|nr:hypothetical protein [bacterium]
MEYNAKDKYYSMKRSYERLKKVNTNNGNSISNADPKDATEDFFNQCYHFKDWLKKDTSVTLTENIENFISKSNALSLAADYCISFKHGGLDKNSRSGQELEKMNTHINFDLTPTGFVASARLELTIDGKKYDAFTLATDCMKEWDSFLEQNQIRFSAP